jgi:hypothetical protein
VNGNCLPGIGDTSGLIIKYNFMGKKYHISYYVLKVETAQGITYQAIINRFDGEDICMKSQDFASEEQGYRWIADTLKEMGKREIINWGCCEYLGE